MEKAFEIKKDRRDLSWITSEVLNSPGFKKLQLFLPDLDLKNFMDPVVRQKNIKIIGDRSSMMEEIIKNKGGWLMPQKVYNGDPVFLTRAKDHDSRLEEFIFNLPYTRSLLTRFDYLSNNLFPREIARILEKKGKAKIASFGSGTGEDVMTSLQYFNGEVKADFFDIDHLGLTLGRDMAEKRGIQNQVAFYQEDIRSISRKNYDLGMLVGVICPLPDPLAERVLRALKNNLAPKGRLIVSSSASKMESEDLVGRFLIEYCAGWHLQFRDERRLKKLGEKVGYGVVEVGKEPMDYHKVLIAEKL
jgi:SAM-dependent methyltransferase